jgi:hypothetical protein
VERFSKNTQISTLMKVRPAGAERTDVTKLMVAFRNIANVPNNRKLGI